MNKFLIFTFVTSLMFLYQNCTDLSMQSITELSKDIIGIESIEGDIFVFTLDDLNEYLVTESGFSNFSETIPSSASAIEQITPSNQSISGEALNYLCMVASDSNSAEYYPLAFDDFANTSGDLVPICMPGSACINYVSELGSVKALESNLCKQNSLAKRFNSGQVLQLVRRF